MRKIRINYILYIVVALLLVIMIKDIFNNRIKNINISLNEFEKNVNIDSVTSVEIYKNLDYAIIGYTNKNYKINYGSLEIFETKINSLLSNINIKYKNKISNTNIIFIILYSLIILFLIYYIYNVIKTNKKQKEVINNINLQNLQTKLNKEQQEINIVKSNIKFNDVAGLNEAKFEINEIVDFLKNPKKYTSLGANIPKGVLLIGPPGTGKTMLAKAISGESNVPFFSMCGSDFVEMYVGVGASRVRELFKKAKEHKPCIIFIDEIDAIGKQRGVVTDSNDERDNTLNQLLTEMDGFNENNGIIVIAATNRSDVLDSALTRAGRFDRQIHIDLPDLNERLEILKVHIKKLKVSDNLNLEKISKQTVGLSGADIANICNEAAIFAARNNKSQIDNEDFFESIDRIIGGLEKKSIISDKEKRTIAYHEAGHAIVSWLIKDYNSLTKVTIIPRGNSLGAAWYLPKENKIKTKQELLNEIIVTLAGRASEEAIIGEISTGALNDLEKATKIAYSMCNDYGLNDKIGHVSYNNNNKFIKPFGENKANEIDNEIKNIITESYNNAKDIILKNKSKLKKIANLLIEKEVIFNEDIENILGKK